MPVAQEIAATFIRQVAHLVLKNSDFMHPKMTMETQQPLHARIPDFTPRPRPVPEPEPEEPAVAEAPEPERPWKGPGCIAGEETIEVHGYLQRLAKGNGGFGILRDGKERLEKGADGAERFGAPVLAAQIRQVAEKLPDVHTAEEAATLARELDPLVDQSWEVAIRCGQVGQGLARRAFELANQVMDGTLSHEEAAATILNEST